MTRGSYFVTLGVAELIGYATHGLAGLAGVGGVVLAGYVISVRLHPRQRCRRCNGTGERRGSVFSWTFRRCQYCDGGRLLRAGNAVVGTSHYARLYAARKAARAKARAEHTHR